MRGGIGMGGGDGRGGGGGGVRYIRNKIQYVIIRKPSLLVDALGVLTWGFPFVNNFIWGLPFVNSFTWGLPFVIALHGTYPL